MSFVANRPSLISSPVCPIFPLSQFSFLCPCLHPFTSPPALTDVLMSPLPFPLNYSPLLLFYHSHCVFRGKKTSINKSRRGYLLSRPWLSEGRSECLLEEWIFFCFVSGLGEFFVPAFCPLTFSRMSLCMILPDKSLITLSAHCQVLAAWMYWTLGLRARASLCVCMRK